MAFTIYKSDGTPITVSTVQNSTYSLVLSGTGSSSYPQDIAQNFVRHLENFANSTPPSGTAVRGQLWYDTSTSELKVYSGSAWVVTGGTGGGGGTGYMGSTGYTGSRGAVGFMGSAGLPGVGGATAPFVLVTGNTQVAVENYHYALTNAQATTVTLPSSPVLGDQVTITVANGRIDNVVVRNGSNIMALADNVTLNIANSTTSLRYINTNLGWWIV